MDMLCLLPLDFLYLKFGVNPLLRLPRCLKVRPVASPSKAFTCIGTGAGISMSALSRTGEWEVAVRGVPRGKAVWFPLD